MNTKTTTSLAYREATKAYEEYIKTHAATDFKLEIERYRKMLNIFLLGNYFYIIFNPFLAKIEHCGKGVARVLGFTPSEFTPQLFFQHLHPADAKNYVAFNAEVAIFFKSLPPEKVMNYKIQFDFRIKRKDNRYIRIMQQKVAIHVAEDGTVMHTLLVFTDISHLKKSNHMSLSIVGLNDDTDPVKAHLGTSKLETVLSSREKEVLALLSQNHTSSQIAELLCISKNTVDNHRRNMLLKTESASTLQLVMRALAEGWV